MGRRSKEYSVDFRNAIIKLRNDGISFGQISTMLQCPKSTVHSIVKKYFREGTFLSLPRSGRPRITTVREDRIIQRCVKKNRRASANALSIQLNKTNNIIASPSTIRNRLRQIDLHGRMAKKKPFISKKNIKERVKWVRNLLSDHMDWNTVLWSDESKFNVFGSDGKVTVWRTAKEEMKLECLRPTVKHGGGSVMVWGCFSSVGVGKLHFIDGIMKKEDYLNILKENLVQTTQQLGMESNFKFQHDRDPKHTAKIVTKWLKDTGIEVMQWVGQSPDMNPIENLWAYLKRKLREREITGKEMLKACIIEEWQKIPSDFCKKLVHSMDNRCQMVLNSKGRPIKY